MRCQRCGKSIGALRQLVDRQFCCDEHRRRGPLASASAIRDFEDHADPMWSGLSGLQTPPAAQKSSGASLAPFVLVTLGLMLGARIWFPEQGVSGGSRPGPAPSTAPAVSSAPDREETGPGGLLDWLGELLPGRKPVQLKLVPSPNLAAWTPPAASSGRKLPWRTNRGALYPGALRLWTPTLAATDYDFRFSGVIERRAMSWTWRARDPSNYYAAKIRLPGPKGGSPMLERYVVLAAQIQRRHEFPLPVSIERAKPYEVTVAVRGPTFRTLLDGSLIDEWTDSRLGSGGVGFFADEGETSGILWARFRERTGLLERLNLAFLLAAPGANLELPR